MKKELLPACGGTGEFLKTQKLMTIASGEGGVWETKKFEAQKTNNRWEHILKTVRFFEFIAVLNNVRLKVIVKEVEGGEKHFWSVIPFWGIDKVNSKRVLHSGNLEHD